MFNTWYLVFIGIVSFLVTDCDASVRLRLETLEMEMRHINTSSNDMQLVIYNMCDRFDELNETLSRDAHKCESSIQNESLSLRSLAHQVGQITRRMEGFAHKVEDNDRMYHSHDTFERRQLKRFQKELHAAQEGIKKLNTEQGKMVALLKDLVEGNAANVHDIQDIIKDKQIEYENFNSLKVVADERFQKCEKAISTLHEDISDLRESLHDRKTNCPDGWRKVGRVCYMYVDNLKTWDSALEYCKRRGGFLIEPDSDQKISSLKEHVLGEIQASSLWVGGKFMKIRGGWTGIWVGTNREMVQNGDKTFAFESNYRELCTVMWRSSASLWDAQCDGLSPFICEQTTK